MVNGQAGKGDSYRKVDPVKFRSNYDKIFKKPKTNGNKKDKDRRKKH